MDSEIDYYDYRNAMFLNIKEALREAGILFYSEIMTIEESDETDAIGFMHITANPKDVSVEFLCSWLNSFLLTPPPSAYCSAWIVYKSVKVAIKKASND